MIKVLWYNQIYKKNICKLFVPYEIIVKYLVLIVPKWNKVKNIRGIAKDKRLVRRVGHKQKSFF